MWRYDPTSVTGISAAPSLNNTMFSAEAGWCSVRKLIILWCPERFLAIAWYIVAVILYNWSNCWSFKCTGLIWTFRGEILQLYSCYCRKPELTFINKSLFFYRTLILHNYFVLWFRSIRYLSSLDPRDLMHPWPDTWRCLCYVI